MLALSLSQFHFQIVSQKWLDRLNVNLACACNWSSRCALLKGDLKLIVVAYLYILSLSFFCFQTVSQKYVDRFNSNLVVIGFQGVPPY